MDAIERKANLVALIQQLQARAENDCVGIQAATPAPGAPNITPEAHKSWADQLASSQAEAAGLKDLLEYVQACPVDPLEAGTELERVQTELAAATEEVGVLNAQAAMKDASLDTDKEKLENKLTEAIEALATANAAHAQTIAEFQRTGKVDVTNRF